jgi:hypothetical protein
MGTPMAFTTGTTYTYTDRMFKRGTIGLNLPATLAPGYNWFNGVDVTSSQYLIYSDTYTTGIASQANSRPTAWTTPDKTDASLLGLINTLPERVGQTSFTNVTDARTWLQESNRYFLINSGYEDIVTDQLLINLDANWYNSYKTGNTTWNDISGNFNNATLTNSPAFDTRNGGSVVFDGTDDYGNFGNLSYNRSNFSVFTWVNYPTTHPLWDSSIVAKWFTGGSNGANNEWSFGGDGQVGPGPFAAVVQYAAGGSSILSVVGGPIYSANTWYNVGFTWTGGTLSLYVNGVMVASGYTANSSAQTTTQPLTIATFNNLSTYCTNIKLGSFLMYNKALSQAEILKNYNTQKGRYGFDNIVSSGLKLNLNSQIPLSYTGGGNSFYDLSGNNNTGTLNNGPTFDSTTRSIVFDGSDDNISVNYNTSLISGNFTLSCLVYKTRNAMEGIVSNEPLQNQQPYENYVGYGFRNRNDGSLWFVISQQGYGTTISSSSTPINQWYHLVGTKNGTNVTFYINGSQVGTATSFTPNINSTNNLSIGRLIGGGEAFSGKISMVSYNDRTLSATEVLQNYYQGNVVTSGLVLALDAGNLVSYGGTGTSWKDLTNLTTGTTLVNGPTYNTLNGGSILFDGTDDVAILYGNPLITGTGDFTICCWVKRGTTGGSADFIAGNYGPGNNGIELYYYQNKVILYATDVYIFSVITVTDTNWHFVCVTRSSGVGNIYFDGNLDKTQSINVSIPGNNPFTIGNGYDYNSEALQGNISVCNVYNRALSAMEIQQNFNAHRGRYGL